MRRDIDADRGGVDFLFRQLFLEGVDLLTRARRDTQIGGVDGGNVERVRRQVAHFAFRHRHAQHTALIDTFKQFAAQHDQGQRILEREHTCLTRSHILAHAVSDKGIRLQPPGLVHGAQRIGRGEQGRQSERGLFERPGRRFDVLDTRIEERLERAAQLWFDDRQALIHCVAIDLVLRVELASHGGILRAPTREHEDGSRAALFGFSGGNQFVFWIAQTGHRIGGIGGDNGAAMRHMTAPERQCISSVSKAERGVLFEPVCQTERGRIQGFRRLR